MAPSSSVPSSCTGEFELHRRLRRWLAAELRALRPVVEASAAACSAEQSRKHVLAVPVNALLARQGGGYGVELAANHRVVPVEVGLFAGGYVEVSGRSIREGTRVVVPRE